VRILIADLNTMRAEALESALLEVAGAKITRLRPGETLVDAIRATAPDVVLVDMALPDRDSLEDIRRAAADAPRPIVMFVDRDDPGFMEAAIAAGVSSYNVVDATLPAVKPIISTAIALFARHAELQARLREAETSLDERRTIDRAKALLMRRRGVSEPDAYRWLRRRAMNQGRRIVDVAAEVVAETDESLGR
jgi:response regulator NasT